MTSQAVLAHQGVSEWPLTILNGLSVYEENIKLIFYFQLFHLFCRV